MVTCGEYEIERAIGWGRRATFLAARTASTAGEFKLVIRLARSGERTFSQALLRSAAEQQAAVGAGCRRLAPILAFEIDARGFAYYATTRFETSLADFLDTGCKVDSGSLREIVTGVLGALQELHEKSRRAHGNITPGNVLLDAQGNVFLTDLAPSGRDVKVADDLFALGTLIYQLVRRSARVGTLTPPLDYSPEWTESLDADAESWREFTNRLLTKSRLTGADALKAALADLKSLKSLEAKETRETSSAATAGHGGGRPKPPRERKLWPKIAALLLLVAGGGGGFWYVSHEKQKAREKEEERIKEAARKKFEAALGEKLKPFRDAIQGKIAIELAGDRDLRSIFKRINDDLNAGQAGGGISPEGIQSQVQLRLDGWPVRERLKSRAVRWRETPREWKRFADEIEAASRITVAAESGSDRQIIDQLVQASQRLGQADAIEGEWTAITSNLAFLEQTKNPLLPDFTQWAAGEIGNAGRIEDAAVRAKAVLEKLTAVADFSTKQWSRVLQDRFKAEAAEVVNRPSPESMGEWPREWVRQATRFLRPPEDKLNLWRKAIARAESRIPTRPPKEQPALQEQLDALRRGIDTALESDIESRDRNAANLNRVRDPIEDIHDQYVAFLGPWKVKAAAATTKDLATAALGEFKTFTAKIPAAYWSKVSFDPGRIAQDLAGAVATPDEMNLNFSVGGWEKVSSTPTVAFYQLGGVTVPFLPLSKTGPAMAAIETPLLLARPAGATFTPGAGPQIRTADFRGLADWLWSGPKDFIQGNGIAKYLANGVTAGDVGSDMCPATWLSFDEAKTMAEKLGGRLPTPEEWKSATDRAGAVRRLRSAAWTTQFGLVGTWRTMAIGHAGRLPDVGSFSKQGNLTANNNYLTDSSAAPGATNDGALWLRSVMPEGGWKPEHKFHHLIGNAAEWVNDGGTPRIMGGSVVSPPSLPTTEKLTPPNSGSRFAVFDVTFRLVVPMLEGGAGLGLAKFKEAAASIPIPHAPVIQ